MSVLDILRMHTTLHNAAVNIIMTSPYHTAIPSPVKAGWMLSVQHVNVIVIILPYNRAMPGHPLVKSV